MYACEGQGAAGVGKAIDGTTVGGERGVRYGEEEGVRYGEEESRYWGGEAVWS